MESDISALQLLEEVGDDEFGRYPCAPASCVPETCAPFCGSCAITTG